MGRRGRFHIWERHLGEVLFNLLKEHELKFNVTAINSKHRSYPLARFLARIFLYIHTAGVRDHFHSKYVKMYGESGHFLKARMNWVVGLIIFQAFSTRCDQPLNKSFPPPLMSTSFPLFFAYGSYAFVLLIIGT